ncbi:MAG: DUF6538 domain-containing protein [Gammaproteobacteria bacterium]
MALMSYVVRDKHGAYHFRRVIPETLRDAFGRKVIKHSLRTKNPAETKQRAQAVGLEIERRLEAARAGSRLTRSQAMDYASRYWIEQLDLHRRWRLRNPDPEPDEYGATDSQNAASHYLSAVLNVEELGRTDWDSASELHAVADELIRNLNAVGSVLSWLAKNGVIEYNPAAGVQAIEQPTHATARLPFTVDDVRTVFASRIWQQPATEEGSERYAVTSY